MKMNGYRSFTESRTRGRLSKSLIFLKSPHLRSTNCVKFLHRKPYLTWSFY
jgi:hypothetical protein